jgi:nitrate reductase NapE component
VVIVTGYGTEANEAMAEQVGVADFLRKPLLPETLEEVARRTLERARPAEQVAVEAAPEVQAQPQMGVAGRLGLFFAAPFIGLAYILAFPFVGAYAFIKWSLKGKAENQG